MRIRIGLCDKERVTSTASVKHLKFIPLRTTK